MADILVRVGKSSEVTILSEQNMCIPPPPPPQAKKEVKKYASVNV